MSTKRRVRLSSTFVKNVSEPGRYGDGRGGYGLSLLVRSTANGRLSKTWSQRLRIDGDIVTRGLGTFPLVSLAMARDAARDNAIRVAEGQDIRKEPPKTPSVAEAFEVVIELRRPSWENDRTEYMWRRSMGFCRSILSKLVSDVTVSDVRQLMFPLWHGRNKTAKEVRSNLSTVMQWAIDEGYRGSNPVSPRIASSFGKAPPPVHHSSIDAKALGSALALVRDKDHWWAAKLCLIFLAFTCVRSGEAREAHWEEIEWKNATWRIPASRMKNGIEHRVPLSEQAMDILAYAWEMTGGEGKIFPSRRVGKYMTCGALSDIFKALGVPCVPHGMRASFRNWADPNGVTEGVAEMVLSHIQPDPVKRAYKTSDFFEYRKPVMQKWADFLTKGMGAVVPGGADPRPLRRSQVPGGVVDKKKAAALAGRGLAASCRSGAIS